MYSKNISLFGYFNPEIGEYVKPKEFNIGVRKKFPTSLTDQSYYVPAKRAVTGQNVSQSSIDPSMYDFPDGKITQALSDSMVDARLPGLDIVERKEKIDDAIKHVENLVKNDLDADLKKQVAKATREKSINDTIQSVKNSNQTVTQLVTQSANK